NNLIHRNIKPDNFLVGRPATKNANGTRRESEHRRSSKAPPMLAPVSTNTPGQSTPLSAAAQVNVPVAAMHHSGHNPSPQHPYAAGGFEYPRGEATTEDAYTQPTVWLLRTVDPLEFRLDLLRAGTEECLLRTAHLVSHSTRLIDSLPRDSLFTLIPNS
ncbi:hypothetical protein V8E52_011608, partial [Russula decolorans]